MKQEAVKEKVGFDFPLAILKQTEEAGNFHIVGYAATSDFDLQGDIITEDALRESSLDLLKNSTVLLNHDITIPIGKVTKAEFDKHGLLIDVLISKTEPDIIQKIKEGVLNKFSIRGQVLEREKKYMAEYDRIVNVIKRMSLVEVSLVSVPANPEARAIGWYVSKALEAHDESHPSDAKNSEGGEPMPKEDVVIEEIPQGTEPAPAAEPSTRAKKENSAPPVKESETVPTPVVTEPSVAESTPEKVAGKSPAPVKPKKDAKKDNEVMAEMEPFWPLLDSLISMGGDVAIIALQLKSLLKRMLGDIAYPQPSADAIPPVAPKSIGKEEMAAMIASEVKKQLDPLLSAVPVMRKGFVQKEAEPEDVLKKWKEVSPETKLKAALALQQA
jgi:HK97 family phage prohead protease